MPAAEAASGLAPAAGVRAEWSALPAPLRAAIEASLGSPVTTAVNQPGGFSPGLAARVRCADGGRAFVKAVGTSLNPGTPALFRAEARIAAALPASAPTSRLRATIEQDIDGDAWVALIVDDIEGHTPAVPWRYNDARRALAALVDLASALTPCPVADAPDIAVTLRADMTSYRELAGHPPPAGHFDPWEERHLEALAALGEAALLSIGGDTLCHLDTRADNMLFTPDGGVVIVDWPWASRGAPWIDTVALAIDLARCGHDPESMLAGNPLLAAADPLAVTAFLAGLAGMWSLATARPAPVGLPTVRAFQRAEWAATIAWLKRRTG